MSENGLRGLIELFAMLLIGVSVGVIWRPAGGVLVFGALLLANVWKR